EEEKEEDQEEGRAQTACRGQRRARRRKPAPRRPGQRPRQGRRPNLTLASALHIAHAARIVQRGGVIAYPTEAVFGLGCLPQDRAAVERVLTIKHRSWRKGLLLIGADLEQLERFAVLPPEPTGSEVRCDAAGQRH